jgi:DNA (cytosine-5)-methyltransferase 1
MAMKLTAIDLFAGAGGATAGLKAAGFDVRAAVEIDATAARSYRLNHPETAVIQSDIRLVTGREILRAARLRRGQLAILQACPPCQTWSSLGKRSPSDPRNELVTVVAGLIEGLRPRGFILENVLGLRDDERLADLLRRSRDMGYVSKVYVVDASDFGVPQRRRRLIVLGSRVAGISALPAALADLLPPEFDRSRRTVREAIGRLADGPDALHRYRRLGTLAQMRAEALPAGGRRKDLPERLQLKCHKTLGTRGATAAYGRMAADEVAPTLTTRCTTPACGPYFHPWENRGISLREAALLQTFPADYKFDGHYDEIERQIGNAIPVRLAEAAARAARTILTRGCSIAPAEPASPDGGFVFAG